MAVRGKAGFAGAEVAATVFFHSGSTLPARTSLCGNPFADFRRVEVTGPSFPGEFTLVRHPKPGENATPFVFPNPTQVPPRFKGHKWYSVPFIRKNPTPLTAYGKWLAKHPPKGLKWKTYTLKPGVVYRYADPINLSCMFDMSLAGVYRVRVELAHTHTWSPWANLTVP